MAKIRHQAVNQKFVNTAMNHPLVQGTIPSTIQGQLNNQRHLRRLLFLLRDKLSIHSLMGGMGPEVHRYLGPHSLAQASWELELPHKILARTRIRRVRLNRRDDRTRKEGIPNGDRLRL
jgi:hypothetical protein